MIQQHIPILMYHGFGEQIHSHLRSVNITVENFERQMFFLAENQYSTITDPADFIPGTADNTRKYVMITFDDGFKSVLKYAFPVMKNYGFRGILFIITRVLEDKPFSMSDEMDIIKGDSFLDKAEIQELVGSGWSVQSHSHRHYRLTALKQAELDTELRHSRYLIEDHFNIKAEMLAYPYGLYSSRVLQMVKSVYTYGFSVQNGLENFKDLYCLHRINIFNTDSLSDFQRKVRTGYNGNYDRLKGKVRDFVYRSNLLRDSITRIKSI